MQWKNIKTLKQKLLIEYFIYREVLRILSQG